MLSGLDEIAWDQLRHAYGAASDVPDLLRGLAEGDDDALYELFGNIWHQGTVYEATAYAVPFLIELLDGAPDVAGILGLLTVIAEGSSYADAHQDLESKSTRDSADYQARISRELTWVRAAWDAVAAGVPTYLRLLTDHPDEQVRAGAAHVLGQSLDPDQSAELLERAETDTSPLVRAGVILAAHDLGVATPSPVARWLTDPDPLPRTVAALAAGDRATLELSVPGAIDGLQELPGVDGDPVSWVVDRVVGRPADQVALLGAWLGHADAGFRAEVLGATDGPIQTWRSAAAQLVPAIAGCLTDGARDVRYRAAMSLSQAGRATAAVLDQLWDLLQREPGGFNSPAYYALDALGRLQDPRAASYVAGRLRADPVDWPGLRNVIRHLGPWAPECWDPLADLIARAPAGNDRIAVIDAVGRYLTPSPELVAAVLPVLVAQCAVQPHVTSRVLGDLGPAARDAVPALAALLNHEATIVRVNAARGLALATGDPGRAVPVLREVVRTQARFDRSYALAALGDLGPAAAGESALVEPWFDAEEDWVAVRAVVTYRALTGDDAPALARLPGYVRCLPVGFEAVRCLAAIGPAAATVVPRLSEAVSSERRQTQSGSTNEWVDIDEQWQDLCADALTRIAPRPVTP